VEDSHPEGDSFPLRASFGNLGEDYQKRVRPDDNQNMRPIFLAGDEAQYFVSAGDTLFATTSASSRGITVCATQSLALLYSEMGSDANARFAHRRACCCRRNTKPEAPALELGLSSAPEPSPLSLAHQRMRPVLAVKGLRFAPMNAQKTRALDRSGRTSKRGFLI
jgi:hypothetical protein